MPQNEDGIRMDPPVSLPSAAKHWPAATEEPEPPLEPPVTREVSQGLWASPSWGFSLEAPRGELVQLKLAHQDGAGVLETLGHSGVVVGHEVGEYLGTDAGADATGVVEVLESDGYAVQRTDVVSGPDGVLRGAGLGAGLVGHYGDEGVERTVGLVDALEVRLAQLDGGQLAGGDHLRRFRDRQPAEFGVTHRSWPPARLP